VNHAAAPRVGDGRGRKGQTGRTARVALAPRRWRVPTTATRRAAVPPLENVDSGRLHSRPYRGHESRTVGVVPLCSAEGWRGRSGVAQPRAEARPLRLYFARKAPGVGNRTGPLRGRLARPTFPLCAGDRHVTIPWMTAAVSHRARAVHASSANTRSSRSRITTKK